VPVGGGRSLGGVNRRTLNPLEQKGIVYREYEPTIPPAVTYGITKHMKEIKQVLGELNRLAETWQNEDGAQPHQARG
jgi:DNA-binding HxlR family transcriptional regulator